MIVNLNMSDRTMNEIDRIFEEYNVLSNDIELLTDQIKVHRTKLAGLKLFPPATADNREQYHQWRKKSFALHNQRSDLKIQRMTLSGKINALVIEDEAA